MNIKDFTREDMIHGMTWLAGLSTHSLRLLQALPDFFLGVRSLLEAPGVGDGEARDIVEDKFPLEWETPLIFVEVDVTDEDGDLGLLDHHLRECEGDCAAATAK